MNSREEHEESRRIWEELGLWWDEKAQDGDYFHKAFIFPNIAKLLDLKDQKIILDAGCGNGALARYLTGKGCKVFGVDFSSTLLNQAKKRSSEIEYQQLDLTNRLQLDHLAQDRQFDCIISSMVLHDVSNVVPFFESLKKLLKPNGSFIFSIPHPCFNSPTVLFKPKGSLTIKDYIAPQVHKIKSKPGQPIDQLVFHRPICDYFNFLFEQGMVMNGLIEPCVEPDLLPKNGVWAERLQIPPVMICRFILNK